jgi:hypothetical protein
MGYDVWDPKQRNAATVRQLQDLIDLINSGRWQVLEAEGETSVHDLEPTSVLGANKRLTVSVRVEMAPKAEPVRSVRVY